MALSPYYASHEWPAHVHREYPKWVGDRLVGDPEAEAAALADQPEHAPPPPLANADDIADLKAQVAKLTALLMDRSAPSGPDMGALMLKSMGIASSSGEITPASDPSPVNPPLGMHNDAAATEMRRVAEKTARAAVQVQLNENVAQSVGDARESLWADCDTRRIFYDRRWGIERLRAAIAAADVASEAAD